MDLIRWSDAGDSFIVLDEDEFAKTLIPELFKHNNYASFVRQLNMYGFHKKVGLSDNSMKANERKNKSPSEYSNPYFRRGHPNLLWLINKPKSKPKGGASGGAKGATRRPEVDEDSEEEIVLGDDGNYHLQALPGGQHGHHLKSLPPAGGDEPRERPTLTRQELANLREQIAQLQQGQKVIQQAIGRLRAEHNDMVRQALVFQSQHERHENSINAVLTFLANVFRKSLEDQAGAQNVTDLLAGILPKGGVGGGQSGVVDLGDLGNVMQQQSQGGSAMTPPKRPQRLLPPIPGGGGGARGGHARTVASTPGSTASPSPFSPNVGGQQQQQQMGSVTELFDTPSDTTAAVPSPDTFIRELETNPRQGMMKIINNTNASGVAGAASRARGAAAAAGIDGNLSADQRSQMLNMMSNQQPTTSSTGPTPTAPTPSSTGAAGSGAPAPSPTTPEDFLAENTPLYTFGDDGMMYSQAAVIDTLQRMQQDQSNKIDELSQLLGPLSPSGRIPGLDDAGNPANSYFNSDVDLGQFLDEDAFLSDGANGTSANGTGAGTAPSAAAGAAYGGPLADGNDFNFSLDNSSATKAAAAPPFESPASNGSLEAPSPAGTEEIPRDDLGYELFGGTVPQQPPPQQQQQQPQQQQQHAEDKKGSKRRKVA